VVAIGHFLALLVLLVLAPSSSAQGAKVKFDPVRDLPGYETVRASADKVLYPLDSFDALLGNEMSPAELAATQKRWEDERLAVDKKLADLAADPRAASLFRLEAHLGHHPYFSKIGWTVEEVPAPFALVVQRPPKDDPEHQKKIGALFAPWLTSLSKLFELRVADPAKAKPSAAHGAVPLAVLATPGDFQTALRYVDYDITSTTGALYDVKLGLGVGHDDPFGGAKSVRGRIRPLVTMATVGLLHRYHAAPGLPGSVLITVGLPQYLVEALGDGTATIDAPRARLDSILEANAVLVDPKKRFEFAIRLPDLLSVVDDAAAGGLGSRQAKKVGSTDLSDRRAFWQSFDDQCALWTHFLVDGAEGEHRERWRRYTELVFLGKPANEAMKVAFEGADLVEIERSFWMWIAATTKVWFPTAPIASADAIDILLAGPVATAVAGVSPSAAVPAPAKVAPPEPPLDPKLFAIAPDDLDARVGLEMVRARANDLDGALAGLRAIASTKPANPWAGRVEREITRLDAVVRLRDSWLAALAAKNGRLEIELDGKKLNVPVQKIEAGQVVLAPNKVNVPSVPIGSIRLADILRATEKKEFQAGSEPWARGYLAQLAGDAKSEKLLKGDSPLLRDLREDARVWMSACVRAGDVARIVTDIASNALPVTRAEGEAGLDRVRALLADDDLPSVLLRRAIIERYARASLSAAAKGMDAKEFVRGRMTTGSNGAMELVYDFQQPAEIEDFTKDTEYLLDLRKKYPPLVRTAAEAKVEVFDGRAVLVGPSSWRLPIGIQAPFDVRYTFRFLKIEGEMTAAPVFDVFLCDDGKGSFVRATDFGWILAVDRATNRTAEASPTSSGSYFDDIDYDVEVIHDGARVSTRLAGEDRASCNVGNLRGGGVFLWVHSDQPVSLERLEISGRIDAASIEAARKFWVGRRMTELGF